MAQFEVRTLDKWESIHTYYVERAGKGWIYRGQRCASWHLKTSLERCYDRYGVTEPSEREKVECNLVRAFERAYHEYSRHLPDARCKSEWLSVMQHYGAPTRLLDFTYSIYVAAYFALERAEEGDCAVWAVNRPWAVQNSVAAMKKAGKLDVDQFDRNRCAAAEHAFKGIFWDSPHAAFAYVLTPFRLNERLRIQKGTFLAPGDITIGFEENLTAMPGYDDPANVTKIVIPAKLWREALKHLYDMNISRTSLFPGLEGYARSLGVYDAVFDPVDDWKKTRRLTE